MRRKSKGEDNKSEKTIKRFKKEIEKD